MWNHRGRQIFLEATQSHMTTFTDQDSVPPADLEPKLKGF